MTDNSPAKHGHREAPGEGLAAGEVVLPDIYDTRGGIGDDNEVKTKGVALTVAWDINDVLTFKSITAYREGHTNTLIDFDIEPSAGAGRPRPLQRRPDHPGTAVAVRRRASAGRRGSLLPGCIGRRQIRHHRGSPQHDDRDVGRRRHEELRRLRRRKLRLHRQAACVASAAVTRATTRTGSVYRQNFTGLYSPLFGNDAAVPGLAAFRLHERSHVRQVHAARQRQLRLPATR